jgi:adenine phosphoribosyltransferase
MVSVATGEVICVGRVPSQYRPTDAVRLVPEDENDLLWAIRGAGTNFGIVVSVTFKAYKARVHSVRNWVVPMDEALEARGKLRDLDELISKKLPRNCSADAYLYWDEDKLRLGVSMFEASSPTPTWTGAPETPTSMYILTTSILGRPEDNMKTAVDGVGLFDTEMYMSGMHGGHGGGKTSSFKRCLFLKSIGNPEVAGPLLEAVEISPSPLCYIHLLQGGGAVDDITEDATAFGCRDWDFACIVTGVWPRDQDGTEVSRDAVQWVYDVVRCLLPLSAGAYAADLGPGPRDAPLAARAFGLNRPRLSRLKRSFDPDNVLAFACPISAPPSERPTLIVLVTGESCAGKDYSAAIWASTFIASGLTARVVSISDATKREYAAVKGANLGRLLHDREYKEQHRPALTAYFQDQVRRRPQLPEEHFVEVVGGAADVEVLFITGMRDEEPVAALSHLVPDSRLVEIWVRASKETRQSRRGCSQPRSASEENSDRDPGDGQADTGPATHIFDNDTTGPQEGRRFCEQYLLPLVHKDLERLSRMVQSVPDFPRRGIEFRHVLDIAQKPGGLVLCTSLLQTHFTGDWAKVDAVACCETGGFLYASALAATVDVPLALIRKAGKLPPPTVSVTKSPSHISSFSTAANNSLGEGSFEMGRDVVPMGASVLVVDDVLATGKTLRAVLQLLQKAGVRANCVHVMVVAEFPVHRGRDLLRRAGFGGVKVQSLLVFGGA